MTNKINPLTTPKIIAIAGDWHENSSYAVRAIDYAAEKGATVILHTGDFGFRFGQVFMGKVNKALTKNKMTLMFVDGNHDNHHYLGSLPLDPDTGLRPLTKRIHHIPRGFRWEWDEIKFLGLGGAHSVDRQSLLRVPGVTWWPEETLSHADIGNAINGGSTDVMITHDCPSGVPIPGLDPSGFPKEEIKASEEHSKLLRMVVESVKPRVLFHGHYHTYYRHTIKLDGRVCHVVGLSLDGGALQHNVIVGKLENILG